MKNTDFKTACNLLLEKERFCLICHNKPDGDTLGSAAALLVCLLRLGKVAHLFCADSLPKRLEFITSFCEEKYLHFENNTYELQGFAPDCVITVDVASPSLISEYAPSVFLAIDHHMNTCVDAEYLLSQSSASAAGEIVQELIFELEKVSAKSIVDKNIASLLFTAISSDSGNFMYSNTGINTFLCAAKLLERGAQAAEISRLLFEVKNMKTLKSEALCVEKCEMFYNGELSLCIFTSEDMEKAQITAEDTETVVQLLRQIQGVSAGLFIRENKDGSFKLSVRSNGGFDACAFCAHFGGGGHQKAAGCTVSGEISEIKEKILQTAFEFLPKK